MELRLKLFKQLAELFRSHNYSLYMVGGSSRDYLLSLPLTDMDLVTDATPSEMKAFLNNADFTFEKYGSIKLVLEGIKFDITTLRKETDYLDSRHPSKVIFTKDLNEDVSRRDLTINALYLDSDLNLIDLVNGKYDLDNRLIKMIGNPLKRIIEDPLRIVRIFRFSLDLGFSVDSELLDCVNNNMSLLSVLNKDKIREEIRKCSHKEELKKMIKLIDL